MLVISKYLAHYSLDMFLNNLGESWMIEAKIWSQLDMIQQVLTSCSHLGKTSAKIWNLMKAKDGIDCLLHKIQCKKVKAQVTLELHCMMRNNLNQLSLHKFKE